MTRAQALSFAVIFGFVVLGLISVMFLLLFPYDQVFVPTPTVTPTATVTPTPTIKRFLPTANVVTPTDTPFPTPVSTRVPTVTPLPTKVPSPTSKLVLPTRFIRPTETPSPVVPVVTPQTATPTVTNVPARAYNVLFSAEDAIISKGKCTNLNWQVSGQARVTLNRRTVEPAGQEEVCPSRSTDYTLEIQIEGSAQVDRYKVQVIVK